MPDLSCDIFKPASYCTGDTVFGPPALLFIQFPFEDAEPFQRERGKKLIRLTGRKIFPLRMIAGKGIRMKPFPLYSKPEQFPLPGCRPGPAPRPGRAVACSMFNYRGLYLKHLRAVKARPAVSGAYDKIRGVHLRKARR